MLFPLVLFLSHSHFKYFPLWILVSLVLYSCILNGYSCRNDSSDYESLLLSQDDYAIDETENLFLIRNECAVNNGNCSHICIDLDLSYKCNCYPNHTLVNSTHCVHDCQFCSQTCTFIDQKTRCDCSSGYEQDSSDSRRCRAVDRNGTFLITTYKGILKISLDDLQSIKSTIYSDEIRPLISCIDYDIKRAEIIWNDHHAHALYKSPFDDLTNRTMILERRMPSFKDGFVIDWIYDHIYWIDFRGSRFMLSDIEGTWHKSLMTPGISPTLIRGIAVDPLQHFLFWIQNSKHKKTGGSIVRSGLDALNAQVIVAMDGHLSSLTLDLSKKRVYWAFKSFYSIYSCDYNGDDHRLIVQSRDFLNDVYSITTFEDRVYWTEVGSNELYSVSEFGGLKTDQTMNPPVNIQEYGYWLYGITIYHALKQPPGINYCTFHKCSHFCLVSSVKNSTVPVTSCHCPDGMQLMEDEQTCRNYPNPALIPIHPSSDISKNGISFSTILLIIFGLLIVTVILVLVYRHNNTQIIQYVSILFPSNGNTPQHLRDEALLQESFMI